MILQLLESGNYEEAYALYEELGNSDAIKQNKNDRAMSLIESGNYDEAYALLEEIGNNGAITDSINTRADALIASGDYETAYSLLQETGNLDLLRGLGAEEYCQMLRSLDLSEGDIIVFGDYNGECEWRVLDVTDNEVLIISRHCVDCRSFDNDSNEWTNSSLRSWLNSEYYNEAFNSTEQSMIQTVNNDNVFLLSIEEAESYFSGHQGRIANYNGANCNWWLRSPGDSSHYAAFVTSYGNIRQNGVYVSDRYGVRPAIWISLGSDG